MTEKTEEQIAREKAATDSLRNAQSNIRHSLDRIDTLEQAIRVALNHMNQHVRFVGSEAYVYEGKKSHQQIVREHIAALNAAL